MVIKTYQKALEHLLEEPPTTMLQNWGLGRLMGLNFRIEQKKDKDNVVADVLSRNSTQGKLASMFVITFELIHRVKDS